MEREESLLASVQTLRDAFTKAERSHPGVTEQFLSGLLEAEGVEVNLPEALLQLACQDGDHYTIPSEEKEYTLLNERARGSTLCMYDMYMCILYYSVCTYSSQGKVESHPGSDSRPFAVSEDHQVNVSDTECTE